MILTYREPERRKSGLDAIYLFGRRAAARPNLCRYARSTRFKTRDPRGRAVSWPTSFRSGAWSRRRLEERGGTRIARYDELLQFVRFCIIGENHPVRLPDIPMYLDFARDGRVPPWPDADGRQPLSRRLSRSTVFRPRAGRAFSTRST